MTDLNCDGLNVELICAYCIKELKQRQTDLNCDGLNVELICAYCIKETKSATINIFRKISFLFKSFVKAELS